MRPRPKTKFAGWNDSISPLSAVLRAARKRADLVEAAGIEQRVDPLAHRELSAIVLALDLVRPAHLPGERLAAAQFLDVGFPAQLMPPRSTGRTRDYSILVERI